MTVLFAGIGWFVVGFFAFGFALVIWEKGITFFTDNRVKKGK